MITYKKMIEFNRNFCKNWTYPLRWLWYFKMSIAVGIFGLVNGGRFDGSLVLFSFWAFWGLFYMGWLCDILFLGSDFITANAPKGSGWFRIKLDVYNASIAEFIKRESIEKDPRQAECYWYLSKFSVYHPVIKILGFAVFLFIVIFAGICVSFPNFAHVFNDLFDYQLFFIIENTSRDLETLGRSDVIPMQRAVGTFILCWTIIIGFIFIFSKAKPFYMIHRYMNDRKLARILSECNYNLVEIKNTICGVPILVGVFATKLMIFSYIYALLISTDLLFLITENKNFSGIMLFEYKLFFMFVVQAIIWYGSGLIVIISLRRLYLNCCYYWWIKNSKQLNFINNGGK